MEEPLLASGRDNPFGFTKNPSVNVSSPQTGSAPWCETGTKVDLFFLGCAQPRTCWDTHWYKPQKRRNFRISVEAAGGWGGSPGYGFHIRMESVSKFWKSLVPTKLRAYVKDYCKRNGLLTLSVIAVVTGCVLGFVLRSFNLSTQVGPNNSVGVLSQRVCDGIRILR